MLKCTNIFTVIYAECIFTVIYVYDIIEKEDGDIMAVSKAQQKAVHNYVKKNYDRIEITAPKGKKAEIQAAAEKQGESLNAYVIGAVERRMKAEQEDNTE